MWSSLDFESSHVEVLGEPLAAGDTLSRVRAGGLLSVQLAFHEPSCRLIWEQGVPTKPLVLKLCQL